MKYLMAMAGLVFLATWQPESRAVPQPIDPDTNRPTSQSTLHRQSIQTVVEVTPALLAADRQEVPFEFRKIWDAAPHNAFTDLIRWDNKFYCAFRTGTGHVPGIAGENGKIQVIASEDGQIWLPAGTIAEPGIDLRDPKLSIAPNGSLMLLIGGSRYDGAKLLGCAPRVCFLQPGDRQFSPVQLATLDSKIEGNNNWLWRVTWHDGVGYGVVYQSNQSPSGLHLVRTTDGIDYQWVKTFDLRGKPNESTIRFDSNDVMHIVVRNEDGRRIGHFGHSSKPYSDWKWSPIKQRLGGPNMIQLPDNSWLLGTREYGNSAKTVLGRLELDGGFTRLITFPSGGDTSYPGMLVYQDQVWFSYYASHEGKASIYLAQIKVSDLVQQ